MPQGNSTSESSDDDERPPSLVSRPTITQRITSRLWTFDDFDPYQIFKVSHKKCLSLRVQVYHGKNVGKGWWTAYSLYKPSPYLVLHLKGSPDGHRRTPIVKNSCSPEWNVSFSMAFDPEGPQNIFISLMDSNYLVDTVIGAESIHFGHLPLNFEEDYIVEFEDGSKVLVVFSVVECSKLDLRFSLTLPKEEIDFVQKRRIKIFEAMKNFLSPEYAPKSISEVPVVSVMCSGGGLRAVIANTGVFKALSESGLLDCIMYVASLSGSSWTIVRYTMPLAGRTFLDWLSHSPDTNAIENLWGEKYLTYLYTHPNFPENCKPGDVIPDIRDKLTMNLKKLFTLKNVYATLKLLMAKALQGLSINLIDVYGYVMGDRLLGEKIINGAAPMPLFTCIVAKTEVSERVYQEFVEFSPYEVGLPKYGAFTKSENFGSRFYVGKIIQRFSEMPLHYLIGVWGSAFSISFRRLIAEETKKQKIKIVGERMTFSSGLLQDRNEEEEDEYLSKEFLDDEENLKTFDQEYDMDYLKEVKDRLSAQLTISGNNEDGENSDEGSIHLNKNKKRTVKFEEEESEKEEEDITRDSVTNFVMKTSDKGLPIFPYHGRRHQLTDSSDDEGSESSSDSLFLFNPPTSWNRRSTFFKDLRFARMVAKKTAETVGFWRNLFKNLITKGYIADTRFGRAGAVFNPLYGMDLAYTFPISPLFEPLNLQDVRSEADFSGIQEPLEANVKKLCLIDAGLTFNSPYPLLLRPQRAVDVFISFDYSSRPADFYDPFEELILAEQWAKKNHVLFPPVQHLVQQFYKEPMREIYVFKDPFNLYCPIVVHCIIFNGLFTTHKAPGVKRETPEEVEFGNFKIFSDPSNPYSSFNLTYSPLLFDRMSKLMEFNTLYGMNIFRNVLRSAIRRKKELRH